ncbi:hypothetical protein CGRA01v4_02090 [Colletotrichum graminicola]|nr:hypothetical protein CGRA01v4_02090 [Colletotrichum graminicola]
MSISTLEAHPSFAWHSAHRICMVWVSNDPPGQ